MARMSAEARSATAYRSGGSPPGVPEGFGPAEARIWRDIVAEKPLGWFDSGSLPILAQYCRTVVIAEKVASKMVDLEFDDPAAIDLGKHLVRLNGSLTTMATKLRLSVQALVERHSRMISERNEGEAEIEDNLLGGAAVWADNQAVN